VNGRRRERKLGRLEDGGERKEERFVQRQSTLDGLMIIFGSLQKVWKIKMIRLLNAIPA
jgi:hypothetical protein